MKKKKKRHADFAKFTFIAVVKRLRFEIYFWDFGNGKISKSKVFYFPPDLPIYRSLMIAH